jgi:hypothetical protein
MAQSYNTLKVPNSISHVSVDDIKSAQQSDESMAKIGEQVKSEAILVNEVVGSLGSMAPYTLPMITSYSGFCRHHTITSPTK